MLQEFLDCHTFARDNGQAKIELGQPNIMVRYKHIELYIGGGVTINCFLRTRWREASPSELR